MSSSLLLNINCSNRYLLVGLLLLVGCANNISLQNDSAGSTVNAAAINQAKNSEPEDSSSVAEQDSSINESLPNNELDAELLAELLVSNLASYQQQWGSASKNALSAAIKTRDYRIARLASLYSMRDKNYPNAVESAELWLELQPEDVDAEITLLLAQLGLGDVDSVMLTLDKRGSSKPIDDHIKEVGGILVRQDNREAALDVAQRFVSDYPDSAQVALSAAYVAQNFKNDTKTDEWLGLALEARPDWALAAQMKSNLLLRQGALDERSAYIREFIEKYPEANAMRVSYAAELAKQENFDEALAQMQQVIANDSSNVAALSYAAALAEQVGQSDLAEKYYRKAIALEPNNDEARWALARKAIEKNDYPRAELHYQRIDSKASYFRAQLQIANMRYHTKGLKSAIGVLRALEPKTEAEYVDRATTRHYLLLQDRKYDEAYSAINETLAFLPDNIELIYARALVAAELNDVVTAEDDLRGIILQFPDHANALNALGYTLADQTDRYAEAKDLIEKALKLRPDEAHILDSMGWVFYRLNEYGQAVEYLQRAYDKAPEVEIAAHLGEVLWEIGETTKAKMIWQEAFEKDDQNPLLQKTIDRYGVTLPASD